jgi:hypothetical protein
MVSIRLAGHQLDCRGRLIEQTEMRLALPRAQFVGVGFYLQQCRREGAAWETRMRNMYIYGQVYKITNVPETTQDIVRNPSLSKSECNEIVGIVGHYSSWPCKCEFALEGSQRTGIAVEAR